MPSRSHRVNHQPVFLLATVPWRESSLRLEVWSRDYGRVGLLARSARKRQSELRGVLVSFVPISMSWYGTQDYKTLHRAEWLGGWAQPQGKALLSGLYVNELLLKLTAREDPHPALYDALVDVMQAICCSDNHLAVLRIFEWRLLRELGLAPDLTCDDAGQPIVAEQDYWLRPQFAVMRLAYARERGMAADLGVVVRGKTLWQLQQACLTDSEALQQVLQLNRMLLDFYVPQGIQSRQIWQQMQQLPRWLSL